jgi:hypothetical protein
MRRASYQHRCLRGVTRKNGTAEWEYLWYELETDGTVRRRSVVIGDIKQYPTDSQARWALERLRLTSGPGPDAGKSKRPLDRPLHSPVISLSHPRRNSKENCFG